MLVITLTAKMAVFLNRMEFESRTHHHTKERKSIEESIKQHTHSFRPSVHFSQIMIHQMTTHFNHFSDRFSSPMYITNLLSILRDIGLLWTTNPVRQPWSMEAITREPWPTTVCRRAWRTTRTTSSTRSTAASTTQTSSWPIVCSSCSTRRKTCNSSSAASR